MQVLKKITILVILIFFIGCNRNSPQQNLNQFTKQFFSKHIPEFPDAQLMTKEDISVKQQQFFDEAKGKLQMLLDLNKNGIPEYIICGFSKKMLFNNEKSPYFISIFEQSDSGLVRLYLQKLLIPPVTLNVSQDTKRSGIVISFAFFSSYGAEIFYENNQYHLDRW